MCLVMQGNYQQRIEYITSLLELDIPILDIGCGELKYYKSMMSRGLSASYYAVDTDPSFEQLADYISRRYDNDNLVFYNSLKQYENVEEVNILLTEVIEHNPLEDAITLIKKALSFNFNQLIISTPNREFNQFYNMETEFRHDDHHFEPSKVEFKELIENCISSMEKPQQYEVEFFHLGDSLNGIQPTQGCVINII